MKAPITWLLKEPSDQDLQFFLFCLQTMVISNSYAMDCPPVRGDKPRALASGLSYVQVGKHGITQYFIPPTSL